MSSLLCIRCTQTHTHTQTQNVFKKKKKEKRYEIFFDFPLNSITILHIINMSDFTTWTHLSISMIKREISSFFSFLNFSWFSFEYQFWGIFFFFWTNAIRIWKCKRIPDFQFDEYTYLLFDILLFVSFSLVWNELLITYWPICECILMTRFGIEFLQTSFDVVWKIKKNKHTCTAHTINQNIVVFFSISNRVWWFAYNCKYDEHFLLKVI